MVDGLEAEVMVIAKFEQLVLGSWPSVAVEGDLSW